MIKLLAEVSVGGWLSNFQRSDWLSGQLLASDRFLRQKHHLFIS